MRNKELARTTPVDFYIPQINKKIKSEDTDIPFLKYIPATRTNHFRSSFFYSKIMSYSTEQEDSTKRRASPKQQEVIEISDDSDDIDSILSKLQSLKFVDASEEEDDTKTSELLQLKKDILHTISEPKLDTTEFDNLYDSTEIIVLKEAVEPLTYQENQLVDRVLRKGQSGQVSQFKKVTVDYKDIYRLYPETWLNDEIVNFYFELLSERAAAPIQQQDQKKDLPSIHCFNTFFCSTLRDQGFAKVKRWTKRVDIFSKDLVFIPINQSYHWVLGVIDMKNKTVLVYDSLGGNHDHTLSLFLNYLEQEHMDKKKKALDTSDWKKQTPKDIPQQGNMSDCGAFTCTFAERLSRHEPFNFSQQDMVVIRRRMVLNILNKAI